MQWIVIKYGDRWLMLTHVYNKHHNVCSYTAMTVQNGSEILVSHQSAMYMVLCCYTCICSPVLVS